MDGTNRSVRWPGTLLGVAGIVSALLGFFVLLGQYTRATGMVQAVAGSTSEQPNTAVAFLLCGGGAFGLALGRRRVAMVSAGCALLLAVLVGLQDACGLDLGIDQWLVKPHVAAKTLHPGRMAPNTALTISLCAGSLILLSASRRATLPFVATGVLGSITVALSAVALIGHALNVESAYRWGASTPMAVATAAGLVVFGTALFLHSLTDHETGRFRVPRWLPVPVAVGGLAASFCVWRALTVDNNDVGTWLVSVFHQDKNLVDQHLPELALVAGLAIALLQPLAIYLGQKAALRAAERRQALQELRKAHDELEQRVQRRTAEIARVNEELQEEIRSRGKLEKMLRQRAELLADADRKKDEFLAILGHELRNPLAALSLGLETLNLLTPGDPAFADTQQIMRQRLAHTVRLVEDLLDVSRFTSGKIRLRKKRVEFGALVSRVVENLRPLAEERGHALSISFPRAPITVEADDVRLEQIVSNLLSNAIKYTDSYGRVQVTVESEGSEVTLRVRDTGIGMAKELLPRIFDSFAQADLSLDRAGGGLGLGLTLVERLVSLHGGTVEAFSEGSGEGSEFVVRLPIVSERKPEDDRVGAETLRAAVSRRVLIVDDKPDLVAMFARLLSVWGHRVVVAHDGPGALDIASTDPPEVALIDIGLPGMTGYDLAGRLRERAADPLLLVAVTGYAQPEHKRRVREAGFDHHLVKPVDLQVLNEILDY